MCLGRCPVFERRHNGTTWAVQRRGGATRRGVTRFGLMPRRDGFTTFATTALTTRLHRLPLSAAAFITTIVAVTSAPAPLHSCFDAAAPLAPSQSTVACAAPATDCCCGRVSAAQVAEPTH